MDKLDKLIEQSLNDEDRRIMVDTAELGFFELGMNQFRGKLGWVTWLMVIAQTIMFVIGVWCAVQFFGSTDMLLALKWGLSSVVLMLVATALKMSLMPQMQADRILRELKRVELMLTSRQ